MIRITWLCVVLASFPRAALAWEPFRSSNADVERGNEHLKKGRFDEALEAYDGAARKLPNEPGVQLDRGLALMAKGKLDEAREAFRSATQGQAPANIRGKAYYHMGLAFLSQADATSGEGGLETAQKFLREAVDAFKSSLRAEPKNRDAAWNLELARRRLVEVDKKREEQKKQQEEQKKQEEEQKKQAPESTPDAGTTPPGQDAGTPEPKNEDSQQQGPDQPKQDSAGQPENGEPKKPGDTGEDQNQQGKNQPDPPKPEAPPKQAGDAQKDPSGEQSPAQRLPEHMRKALDALGTSEENLEKHRAQMRARQRPRRIEKDW